MLLILSTYDSVLRNCALHRVYGLTIRPEKAVVPYRRQSYTSNCLKQVSTLERCKQWLPRAAIGSVPYLQNQMYWIGSGRCHTLIEHSRYCSVNEQASACRGRASSYSWGRSVSGQRLWRTSSMRRSSTQDWIVILILRNGLQKCSVLCPGNMLAQLVHPQPTEDM